MAFILKPLRTLRNHWKKSTVAAIALVYSHEVIKEKLALEDVMREYCGRAAQLGASTLSGNVSARTVTVILNPSANRRRATTEFEKYCAPLLHLAGVSVNVVKTEREGHAKSLMNALNEHTDAIVVAGGDGTFSEVITGLLRHSENLKVPLGVLPLGTHNTLAERLFPLKRRPLKTSEADSTVQKVRQMADATMAIVEEITRPIDVMKIEVLDGADFQPTYAVAAIKWGAYRDVESRKDNYWYYGRFREYAAYLFNGYKSSLTWHCEGIINYSPPCNGCSHCANGGQQSITQKWYHKFGGQSTASLVHIKNPECSLSKQKSVYTVDFTVSPDVKSTPKLRIEMGPRHVKYMHFVKDGFRTVQGQPRHISETLEARQLEIRPKIDDSNHTYSIDNENFDVKPVRITLLPQLINVFIGSNSS